MPGKGKGKGPGDDQGAGGAAGGEKGGNGPREGSGEGRSGRKPEGGRGGEGGRKRRRRGPRRLERWQQVEALVRRLEPDIIDVFRRHQVDPNLASLILEEVVTLLLYRWGQIARPDAWVLEMLERRLERRGQ